jgi:hypothetical protein
MIDWGADQNQAVLQEYRQAVLRIRMFILIFIHSGSNNSNKRGGKNLLSYLFCIHRYPRIVNYLIFEQFKKKM